MNLKVLHIITFSLLINASVFAQKGNQSGKLSFLNSSEKAGTVFILGDSVIIISGSLINVCKNPGTLEVNTYAIIKQQPSPVILQSSKPFITVHGNILYNFNYRSYIDTPFAQDDLVQHFAQTYFNILVKDRYPVTVTISSRNSNSSYFKNTLDVNFRFNRSNLIEKIKNDYKTKLAALKGLTSSNENAVDIAKIETGLSSFANLLDFTALEHHKEDLRNKVNKLQGLQAYINSSSRSQEIVEEKEKILRDSKEGADTVTSNALHRILPSAVAKLEAAKKQLEALKESVRKGVTIIRSEQRKIEDTLNVIRKDLNSLSTGPGLFAFMQKYKMGKNELTKTQRLLLSVNEIGIGRSYVNYSELTVKNISITGFNIEMNPTRFYLAAVAGKVNYLNRDFIYKNEQNHLPSQSLALLRMGIGQKEKTNLIFSYYDGKKSVLNASSAATVNAVQQVRGISAETRIAVDPNNYLVAEFAKSSYSSAAQQPQGSDLTGKIFNLKERSNEAYSIKLFSEYPSTHTKFSGYYKKMGELFQSFTLYPTTVNQQAWMAKINQSLWKRRITVDAAIRKNDFTSPLAAPSYNSNTVFKSLQLMARIPKYPIVSVGYYPSSQLLLNNNNILMESQYNTLNAISSYNYRFRKTAMNTNAVFTKFYNNSSDTGFIYFNAESWSVNQSLFTGKFIFQTSAGLTKQKSLQLFTLEQSLSLKMRSNISFSSSIKWNRFNKRENLIGGAATFNISINRLGSFQFNYEKSYLPGEDRNLRPVEMGRISFYREF